MRRAVRRLRACAQGIPDLRHQRPARAKQACGRSTRHLRSPAAHAGRDAVNHELPLGAPLVEPVPEAAPTEPELDPSRGHAVLGHARSCTGRAQRVACVVECLVVRSPRHRSMSKPSTPPARHAKARRTSCRRVTPARVASVSKSRVPSNDAPRRARSCWISGARPSSPVPVASSHLRCAASIARSLSPWMRMSLAAGASTGKSGGAPPSPPAAWWRRPQIAGGAGAPCVRERLP